jgi:uncharacterized protein YggU (UPF0235/DUF167 family)
MGDLFDPNNLPTHLQVRVTPKAKRNLVKPEHNESGEILYRVYVTTVPEDGKANAAVLKLLAKSMGISVSSLRIVRGETSRDKLIERRK